jgi:hypothetical protein
MSATTEFDLEEQLACIRRSNEETRKFVAEQHKLMEEAGKLTAEAAKLNRDRKLAPLVLLGTFWAALIGALAGLTVKHIGT